MRNFLAILSALFGLTALAMSLVVSGGSWTAEGRDTVISLLMGSMFLGMGAVFIAALLLYYFERRSWWAWLLLALGVSAFAVNYHAFGVL